MFDAVSGFLFAFVVQAGRAKLFFYHSFLMTVISPSLHLDARAQLLTSSEAWLLLDLTVLQASDFWCHLQ